MKKNILQLVPYILIFTMILMACIFERNEDYQSTTPTTVEEVTNSIETQSSIYEPNNDMSFIQEAPSADKAIEVYREEVSKRLANSMEENFLNEKEKVFLSDIYEIVTEAGSAVVYKQNNYYFPIIYSIESNVSVWLMNNQGQIVINPIVGMGYVWKEYPSKENFHCNLQEGETILKSNTQSAVVYNLETRSVTFWNMGNIQAQMFVPEGAICTGYSFLEGVIFRVGSDVYAVRNFQYNVQNNGVHVIAHKVKEVIIADYYLNDEASSNPLFLMEDGSIKAYSSLEGEGELDDESRLVAPEVEGGFHVNETY